MESLEGSPDDGGGGIDGGGAEATGTRQMVEAAGENGLVPWQQ